MNLARSPLRRPNKRQKNERGEDRTRDLRLSDYGIVDRRNIHYATRPCD